MHTDFFRHSNNLSGCPGGASVEKSTCQCSRCKRPRFNPWAGKITWRRKRQPTPVSLPEKIPWTEEPGRLQSMRSQRAGHDTATQQPPHMELPLCETKVMASSPITSWQIDGETMETVADFIFTEFPFKMVDCYTFWGGR